MERTTRKELREFKRSAPAQLGSDLLASDRYVPGLDEHIAGVMTGQTPIEISDAREGMATAIAFYVQLKETMQSVDDLFAEVDVPPPSLTLTEQSFLVGNAVLFMARTLEKTFKEYPRLFQRLSPKLESDEAGNPTYYSNAGKHAFLQLLTPVISYCFTHVMPCDVLRYQYSSESAGSPYQTDIYVGYKWHKSLRDKHGEAYQFIREFLRLLAMGIREKKSLTIRLERSGKDTVLPKNYSDTTVHVTLALCVDGTPHTRVQLRDLQSMVGYFRQQVKEHVKGGSDDLFSRPRIDIQPE